MNGAALALDIGGGHVTAARVDLGRRAVQPGAVRRHVALEWPAAALLTAWADAALDAAGERPDGVGAAVPSPFGYGRVHDGAAGAGVSRMTHKFAALYGVNVGAALMERWRGTVLEDVPLCFGNDADLFALGEWWAGAAQGAGHVIGVTLGTGLGTGFVAGGEVVTSGPGVPPGGELWDQPYLGGVAEDYVSGRAVTRLAHEHGLPPDLGAAQVAALADHGDPAARAAYAALGQHLGAVLSPWAALFRPQAVVVGGNVSLAWPHFQASLQAALPGVAVRPSTLLETAGLLGAARLTTGVHP